MTFDDRTRDRLRAKLEREIGDRAAEAAERIESSVALYGDVHLLDRPDLRKRAKTARAALRTLREALEGDGGDLGIAVDAQMLVRGNLGPLPNLDEIEAYLRRSLPAAFPEGVPVGVADAPEVILPAALHLAHERLGGLPTNRGLKDLDEALLEVDRSNKKDGRPVQARELVIGGVVAGVLMRYGIKATRGSENTESTFESVLAIVFDDLVAKIPDLKVKDDVGRVARHWVDALA